ncbi:MAG: hypothetical protein ACYDDT_12175 [Sulfuricella sp.]
MREELNASVVNRINKGTKLIPVVIDECDVPESLRSTVWQKVDSLDSYDASLQRILAAIFDANDKPAIGRPPSRFTGSESKISGLTRTDDIVLREVARLQIEENDALVMFDRLRIAPAFAEIPEQELTDSLEILDQQHLIKIARVLGAPLSHVVLTDYGFQQYAEAYIADYQDVVARVAALLVNDKRMPERRTGRASFQAGRICRFRAQPHGGQRTHQEIELHWRSFARLADFSVPEARFALVLDN